MFARIAQPQDPGDRFDITTFSKIGRLTHSKLYSSMIGFQESMRAARPLIPDGALRMSRSKNGPILHLAVIACDHAYTHRSLSNTSRSKHPNINTGGMTLICNIASILGERCRAPCQPCWREPQTCHPRLLLKRKTRVGLFPGRNHKQPTPVGSAF